MTAKELQEKCMALQRECNDKQALPGDSPLADTPTARGRPNGSSA